MQQRSQTVDLADVFGSIVNQLQADKDHINGLDQIGGNGNHGDNSLHNFQMVADALQRTRGQDAGTQLRQAAQLLQQNGRGGTAPLYAEGLLNAAQQMQGKPGLGMDDILPFLQSLLGGVQRRTNAQPGQGTMLDALVPSIMGYIGARNSGRSNGDAVMEALGAATRGAQQTYTQPSQFGRGKRSGNPAWQDPGAASANSMLQGLFRSITGL
jgi:phosphoenolpyruvate---glycerone phosphotransferase subunit DhaL